MEIDFDLLEDSIMDIDPDYPESIKKFEKLNKCKVIQSRVEIHHALSKTYYYILDFGKAENLYIEIESSIDVGSLIRKKEWGGKIQNTREIEVMSDIEFDNEEFETWFSQTKVDAKYKGKYLDLAKFLFEREKPNILKSIREQSYDNYVTGGGTTKTDSHYKKEFNLYSKKNIFWKGLFKTKEVHKNFK